MISQSVTARDRYGVLATVFLVLSLLLQLPGNVPYDGIVVWHEAQTRMLYAQHPAAMVLLWHWTDLLVRGPALFTALQLVALWAAAGIVIHRMRAPLWMAAVFCLMLLVWPPLLAFSGLTVKDVFGAHLALLAFALALPRQDHAMSSRRWLVAFALGTLAALFRYQLALTLPVLLILLWQEKRRFGGRQHMLAALGGILVTVSLVSVAVQATFVHRGSGDVQQSLRKVAIYDLAGVVVNDPAVPLPYLTRAGVDVAQLKAKMARDYSPIRVDTLWQEGGQGSGLLAPEGVFKMLVPVSDGLLWQQWAQTVLHAPEALFHHRLATFARVLGAGDIYACRPIRAGISPIPADQAAAMQAQSFHPPASARLMQSRFFPVGLLFRAWLYDLVALVVLGLAAAGRPVPRGAVLLACFAIAYEASYFFLPQACEVRYSYPTMLSAMTALAMLVSSRVGAGDGTG